MERQQATSTAGPTNFLAPAALPRLEAGDHLDQPTFHARYEAMPSSFRAELVEGVVIVPSPLLADHAQFHACLMCWLGVYVLRTPATCALDNATIVLLPDTEVQPDGALILAPSAGGQSRRWQGYIAGPPELVIEVSSSSEAYDLHGKFRSYEAAGVREYLVVLLRDRRAEWFVARDGKFVSQEPDEDRILRSTYFPGLWLDVAALFAPNGVQLMATLDRGLATPEHAQQAAAWKQLLENGAPQSPSSD